MNTWMRWGLIALICIAVAAAAFVGMVAFSGNTASYEGERSVKIPAGTSFETTIDSLDAAGILELSTTFRWLGQATGWRNQVKAGHYAFEAGASNWEMLDRIRKGLQTPVRLTIPPGTRPEIAARVAARHMAFDTEDFQAALRDTALAESLDTTPADLFGYILPETYHFYWRTSAHEVIRRIKQSFDRFADDALREGLAEQDLSTREATVLASIVEWETSLVEEKPHIAGVYLNRLDRRMPLQADPTVQYAVLEKEGSKRRLLFVDYEIEHAYNTYQFRGLPPGPLTNPSPSSLRAVAEPESHSYLYFVANGSGGHTFSRTLREHNRAAQEYYRIMRERRSQQRN